MPEGAKVCGHCGTALVELKPSSANAKTSTAQPVAKKQGNNPPAPVAKKGKGKLKLYLALIVLLVALAGGGLAFAYTQDFLPEALTDSIAVVLPQNLTEDIVEQSLRDLGLENQVFALNRAENREDSSDTLLPTSLQEGDYTIDSIEDIEIRENEDGNTASVEARVTLSNDDLIVVVDILATYRRVDDRWILRDNNIESVEFSPLAAIDEDAIIARVQSYLAIFDGEGTTSNSGGWSNTDSSDPTLTSLYTGGDFSATVELSHLDSGDYLTVAEISLENETHFYTVSGTLSITYRFNNETAQWTLARNDMRLDDSAWTPDYSKIVGTWEGTYRETEGDRARCLGASSTTPQLVIQNIDMQNRTLTGTLSGLSHNHRRHQTNTSNFTTGDISFPATQFIANIDIGTSSITFNYVRVIENSDRFGEVVFCSSLEFVDGTIMGTIRSGDGWWHTSDVFDFRRAD